MGGGASRRLGGFDVHWRRRLGGADLRPGRDVSRCRARLRDGGGGGGNGTLVALHVVVAPEAGGDDGDLDLVLHALIEHGAEDDVGIFVRGASG